MLKLRPYPLKEHSINFIASNTRNPYFCCLK